MAHLDGDTSNKLFETLADWNAALQGTSLAPRIINDAEEVDRLLPPRPANAPRKKKRARRAA
jgi:hypothetical protein